MNLMNSKVITLDVQMYFILLMMRYQDDINTKHSMSQYVARGVSQRTTHLTRAGTREFE